MPRSSEITVDVYEEFKALNEEENELYERKNKDYAGEGDPFGNFRRIANILSNYPGLRIDHPLTTVMHGILKQLDCVLDALATNRDPEEEGLQERLRDISVYCKIAEIMLSTIDGLFPIEEEDEEQIYETTTRENGEREEEEDNGEDDEEVREIETHPGRKKKALPKREARRVSEALTKINKTRRKP